MNLRNNQYWSAAKPCVSLRMLLFVTNDTPRGIRLAAQKAQLRPFAP